MQVDLKPKELFEYQGSSPCPVDIDEYWDRALAEMAAVDAQVELVPSDFQVPDAECYDLWFTGVKGARVHAKYLRPKNAEKPGPAIVQFHGYSGSSGDWWDKLAYVQSGFCIAAIDCRGQGGQSEDVGGVKGNTLHGHIIRGLDSENPDDLLFRDIFLDCAQLVRIVMAQPEVDEKRVGVFGGSQGGALTVAAASLVPEIKFACPIYPFLSDYKRVWEMDLDVAAYAELKEYFRNFDPFHEREDEIFMKLGYIDIENIAKRIRAKVTMFTGLMDTICPPSTQFAAYNKMVCEKEVFFLPDFGHEGLPQVNDRIYQIMLKL